MERACQRVSQTIPLAPAGGASVAALATRIRTRRTPLLGWLNWAAVKSIDGTLSPGPTTGAQCGDCASSVGSETGFVGTGRGIAVPKAPGPDTCRATKRLAP